MSHDSPGSSVLHTPTDDQNFDDVCTYYPIERTAIVLISYSLYELHHEKPCFSSFLPVTKPGLHAGIFSSVSGAEIRPHSQ